MLGLHHPILKSVRKAVHRGSTTPEGLALAEGFHLLHEAIRSNKAIHCVLASPAVEASVRAAIADSAPLYVVDEHILSQVSSVENAQGVLSLIEIAETPLSAIASVECPLILALDGIQDPGNAGAIVRSAEAFGATGLVFIKGTVNPWNPKALRASAGSIFRTPFCVAEWPDFLSAANRGGIALFAASPHAGTSIAHAPLSKPAAILIGNEGAGVPAGHLAAAAAIRIPTQTVESLNAAIAAAILLYEANRQRT